MKKYCILILIVSAALILSACSFLNNNQNNNQNNQNDQNNNQNEVIKNNVDFNLNDYYAVLTPSTQYIEKDSKVIKPADPVRTGYTFSGWFGESDCKTEWDFEKDTVSEHIVLFAKWTKDIYAINFDLAGGNGTTPQSQSLNYLEKVTEPDMDANSSGINQPVKDNFVFGGWWLGSDIDNYTQEWNFSTDLPSSSMTLYAGWGTANFNDDFSFIEMNNCIKILGFKNSTIPENEIIIPQKINNKPVLSIAKGAFKCFQGTSNIKLPEGLTTINDEAFYSCSGVSDLTIPNTVTSIGKRAFHSCSNLYNLKIGSKVKNIGEMAFYQCTSLMSNYNDKLVISSNVLSVEKEAFSITGKAINNLEIQNGVVYIGESAFRYAYILRLNIPDSVETIDKFAFQYSRYLTKLEIGKGIKNLGEQAFSDCYIGLHVIMKSVKVPVIGSIDVFGIFTINNDKPSRPNFFISVPEQSMDSYKNAEKWNVYYKTRIINVIFDDSIIVFPVKE